MSKPARFDWLFRPRLADEDLPLSAEARFAEALAELPAVERSALALSEIGGLDPNEIAQRLGTDPAVARKLLRRARDSVRTSLSAQGRRGLAALIPVQSLWQTGASGPAVRAAGAVAAAIVAPMFVIGGASADLPRTALASPDPPSVRVLDVVDQLVARPAAVPAEVRAGAAATVAARRPAPSARAGGERFSVRPAVAAPVAPAAPAAPRPVPAAPPEQAAEPERPEPARASPLETVARSVAPSSPPAPPQLPPAPPVELPVVPPPLPQLPSPSPPPQLP